MEVNKSERFYLDSARVIAFVNPGLLFMVLSQVRIPDPCRQCKFRLHTSVWQGLNRECSRIQQFAEHLQCVRHCFRLDTAMN